MRFCRQLLTGLALLALVAPGCWFASGQFTVSVALPDPIIVDASQNILASQIDFNSSGDYTDHREDLEGLAEAAILGQFSNPNAPLPSPGPVNVVVFITREFTNHTTAGAVLADDRKVLLWGPLTVGVGESRGVSWNESAALIRPAGKAALLGELKGDGKFTLYAIGESGGYRFRVDGAVAVVVMDAGR